MVFQHIKINFHLISAALNYHNKKQRVGKSTGLATPVECKGTQKINGDKVTSKTTQSKKLLKINISKLTEANDYISILVKHTTDCVNIISPDETGPS